MIETLVAVLGGGTLAGGMVALGWWMGRQTVIVQQAPEKLVLEMGSAPPPFYAPQEDLSFDAEDGPADIFTFSEAEDPEDETEAVPIDARTGFVL